MHNLPRELDDRTKFRRYKKKIKFRNRERIVESEGT